VFGEIALISDGPRTATARASSYCDLYVLPKASFLAIIDAYPEFKSHIEGMMLERQGAKALADAS
jgi:voltage-gated potassium channel